MSARTVFARRVVARRVVRRVLVVLLLTVLSSGTQVSLAQGTGPVQVGGPPVTGVDGSDPSASTTSTPPAATATTFAPIPANGTGPSPTVPETSPSTGAVPTSAAPTPTTTLPPGAPTTTLTPGAPTTTAPASTPAELRAAIERALATTRAGSMGALVSIDGIGVVFDHDADAPRIPASTQKLYVAGTALLVLGGNYVFTTEARTSTVVGSDGLVAGDLVLRASGDPSFGAAQLASMADAVAASGVRSVQGGLVLDDSHFDSQTRVASWKPAFTPGEVGLLDAFAVDGNHRNEPDAGLANLERFRALLLKRSITVVGASRRGSLPSGGPMVGRVQSPPLRDLVRQMLKTSNNTYAELLAKELGAASGRGTTAHGVAVIASAFGKFGLAAPQQVDGSGLSSDNRSTARGQVLWLQKIAAAGVTDLRDGLPIACVDGTLRSRMCRTSAAGKVVAKTGALDNVVAISGYAATAAGHAVTFSFLFNAVPSNARARAAVDQALVAITAANV